jgi:hypothetical protein
MASFVSGLWNQLKPASARSPLLRPAATKTLIILHGATRQSYAFEVHPLEAAACFEEVAAVYVYARDAGPDVARAKAMDSNSRGVDLGFIGQTGDVAKQAAEHELRSHFVGYAFDLLLVLRIDEEAARAQAAQELIAYYRPVLNDLLGSHKSA